METIQALRKTIDEIDERILSFLRERVEICKRIGNAKREHRVPIRDSNRETDVYKHIMVRADEAGLDHNEIRALYRRIIAMCIQAQKGSDNRRP